MKPISAPSLSDRENGDSHASIAQDPNSFLQSALNQSVSRETTLLETVRDAQNAQQLLFLQWQGGNATFTRHLERKGEFCKPPETGFGALSDLRLPDRILPCGNSREMLSDLSFRMCKHVDLEEQDVFLASLFILSSWFPDCSKTVPYLWLVGPLGSGKSTLLKFLHCVCRRALLLGDTRAASLYKFSSILCPTLLLDELEPDNSRSGAEVRRLLRVGNMSGAPAARNGRLFQTFSSKVISSRQPPVDVALASRAIVIRLLPTDKDLLPLDEDTVERIAREFQPRLLMFRLQNYAAVKTSQISFERLGNLTPRVRDLGRALAAPLLGDEHLQDKLFEILREYDSEARIERSLEPEWLVVEALFDLCHSGPSSGRSHICVGGLSFQINKSLERRDEGMRVSARSAGSILKSLGIRTRRLGNLGRGLTLTSILKRKVHELARRFGFDRTHFTSLCGLESGYGGVPCALCEEIGLTGGLRFVDLKATRHRNSQRSASSAYTSKGVTRLS